MIEADRDGSASWPVLAARAVVVPGDATVLEVLRQARVGSARAVIAATGNELLNVEVALMTRELNPAQRVVVRLSDTDLAETLREAANVRLALSVPALAAPAFVAALFGDRVQCAVRVGDRVLMVVEFTVPDGDASLDGQLMREVTADFNVLPVAVVGADGVVKFQSPDMLLAAGDRLTAVAALPDLERLFRRERHASPKEN